MRYNILHKTEVSFHFQDTATALPGTKSTKPNTWYFGLGRRPLAGLDAGLEREMYAHDMNETPKSPALSLLSLLLQ